MDGAEEFFLIPLRLSDVNKLRPYLLKTKYRQQQPQNVLEECHQSELIPNEHHNHHQHEQTKPPHQNTLEECQKPDQEQVKHESMLEECIKPEVKVKQQEQSNNKRKSIEEGLSPERTRPRYSDLTTVV